MRAFTSWRVTRSRASMLARSTLSIDRLVVLDHPVGHVDAEVALGPQHGDPQLAARARPCAPATRVGHRRAGVASGQDVGELGTGHHRQSPTCRLRAALDGAASERLASPAISHAVRRRSLLGEVRVGDGEHLDDEQGGVHGAVDGDGGHRDALGHLHGGVERVDAVERAARQRHADHRQGGVGGHRAGEVGGHARAADEGAVALLARGRGQLGHLGRACGGRRAPARRPRCRTARACRRRAASCPGRWASPSGWRPCSCSSVVLTSGWRCRFDGGTPGQRRWSTRGVGRAPGRWRRSGPWPTTSSTRPPAVTSAPSGACGHAGAEHVDAVDGPGRVEPLDEVAGAEARGVALGGHDDQHRGVVVEGAARCAASPAAASSSSCAEVGGEAEEHDLASGSPKRTLYSTSFGPSAVSISPA